MGKHLSGRGGKKRGRGGRQVREGWEWEGRRKEKHKSKDLGCEEVLFGRFVGSVAKAAGESEFYLLGKRTNSRV